VMITLKDGRQIDNHMASAHQPSAKREGSCDSPLRKQLRGVSNGNYANAIALYPSTTNADSTRRAAAQIPFRDRYGPAFAL